MSISACSAASPWSPRAGAEWIWSRKAMILRGISATGTTKSTRPVAMEFRGISPNSASAGSCTRTRPLYSFTRRRPIEPSAPLPERMTHTARESCVSASVRKKMSTGARRSSYPVTADTISMPSLSVRPLFGGMTYTWSGSTCTEATTWLTGMVAALWITSASRLSYSGERWRMTTYAMPLSAGTLWKNSRKAGMEPAEPPIPTTMKSDFDRAPILPPLPPTPLIRRALFGEGVRNVRGEPIAGRTRMLEQESGAIRAFLKGGTNRAVRCPMRIRGRAWCGTEEVVVPGKDIVVIGGSAGSIEVTRRLLAAPPADFAGSIFVVVHTAPHAPGVLDVIFDSAGPLPAVGAHNGERITPGRVYIAQPDHHLIIEPGKVCLTRVPKENRCRPAIDPLFRSAAQTYGPRVVGIIVTGYLDDGTAGLWTVKQLGGTAVVQDPADALVPFMPLNAVTHVKVDYCVPLEEIAPLLVRLTTEAAEEEA